MYCTPMLHLDILDEELGSSRQELDGVQWLDSWKIEDLSDESPQQSTSE